MRKDVEIINVEGVLGSVQIVLDPRIDQDVILVCRGYLEQSKQHVAVKYNKDYVNIVLSQQLKIEAVVDFAPERGPRKLVNQDS